VTLPFVGEVSNGALGNPIPGNNRLALRGSIRPLALPLGDTTINSEGTLKFPADSGDAVFFYNAEAGRFDDPFEYFADYGWFAATGDQGPAGPVINVGHGFAVRKGASAPDRIWGQIIFEGNPFKVE
jgi:hypothetical protein